MDKEMKGRIKRAAVRTWEIIGADVLRALEDAGQEPSLSKDEVVEVVVDYMQSHGGDKEAFEAWNQMPREEADDLLKQAFQFQKYGW